MKNNTEKLSLSNVQIITRSGLLIALSAIGAMIKIQGTIAFDSMPGYFAALFINPVAGSFVALLGHLLTAATSGFPLTIPMHLIVALEMGLCAYVFGALGRKTNGLIACLAAILLNGPACTLITAMAASGLGLPFSGSAMFYALVIPLTVASAANIILAYLIFRVMEKR